MIFSVIKNIEISFENTSDQEKISIFQFLCEKTNILHLLRSNNITFFLYGELV